MMKYIITWDLGATKCAAGVIEFNRLTDSLVCQKTCHVKVTDASSLAELVKLIEARLGFSFHTADAICIGGAGHFDGQTLLHENAYPYPMHFAALAREQNWPPFTVIHDYASIVCATFTSYMAKAENIKRLNQCEMQTHGRRVALGIGTGLGLKDGVMLPNGDFWLGQNEIGHIGVTCPPTTDAITQARHSELMRFLRTDGSPEATPVTFEKILSGKGMVRLHQFFYPDQGTATPEEVGGHIQSGKAQEMLSAFAWYAGLFVGTVQLTFMPEGGVWITGGVALNHLRAFDLPDFQAGIEASPAYWSQRATYPLGILCNPEHALVGCGYFALKRLF
jgi:glucokinase